LKFKSKMSVADTGDHAELTVVPDDLEGIYIYVADVKSMALGAGQQQQQSLDRAIDRLTTNPLIMQQLQAEGVTVNLKDLLVSDFEGAGLDDAERYFESNSNPPGQAGQGNQAPQVIPNPGMPAGVNPSPQGGQPNSLGQPVRGGLPNQVQPGLQQSPGI
jgi:hypothetical protein